MRLLNFILQHSVAKIPKHLFPRSRKLPFSFHCLVNYLSMQCKVQILSFTFSSRRTTTTKNHRHIVLFLLCLYYAYYACTMPTMPVLCLYYAYYACTMPTMPIYNYPRTTCNITKIHHIRFTDIVVYCILLALAV